MYPSQSPLPLFSLEGKTILIIGASRGLGEKLSLYLNENKVNVIGVSRSKSKGDFKQFVSDIAEISDVLKIVDYLSQSNILLDGIVLNASISSKPKSLESSKNKGDQLQSLKDFKAITDINLVGSYNIISTLVPFLNKNASIVGISSIGAQLGFPNNPAYQASKAGLDAMMRSLAVDLAHLNIRANHINLGYFKAPMTQVSFNDRNLRKERENRIILSRWGEMHEFIGPVCFLLSEASSYITASGINVDGGWKSKGL
tara:strand:- start:3878 stop:4648 length:771 start_codon:yes stop_codon:yes gene_type:complete